MAIQDARGTGTCSCGVEVYVQACDHITVSPPHSVRAGSRGNTHQKNVHIPVTGWRSWLAHLASASSCSCSVAYCGTTGGLCSQVCTIRNVHAAHTARIFRSVYICAGSHATLVFWERRWRVLRHLRQQQHGIGVRCNVLDACQARRVTSRWVDAGKFLTGFSAVGSVAVPAILYHAEVRCTTVVVVSVFFTHVLQLRTCRKSQQGRWACSWQA